MAVPHTNPPVSAVFALPANSPPIFGVVWSGANYVGQAPVAYYDVFASENSAPFTIWQWHTTATSALYSGTFGHTYAFYSVASDTAGNTEVPPPTPDALTTVSLSNAPPTIWFSTNVLAVNEGDRIKMTPTVEDPDLWPETFTFSLLAGAPTGVTVDRTTGQLQWTTARGSGPSTNVLGVVVTDNGFPQLSATGYVTVIIRRLNLPPVLAGIADRIINEGQLLTITNVLTDPNVPRHTWTFSLGAGAPVGASIDSSTGIFRWSPSNIQGPSTNWITVIVADTSLPSLSAAQLFSVIVRDTLNDFVVSVGSTNMFAGESNSVPVVLRSSIDLWGLSFTLQAPEERLTNATLRQTSPEVLSVGWQPLGSGLFSVSLALDPALSPASTRQLAWLDFTAPPAEHSAIVPLGIQTPLGLRAGTTWVTNAEGVGGRVIIVAREPVLTFENPATPIFTLYGFPGLEYVIQGATNLNASASWQDLFALVLTNRAQALIWTNDPAATRFLRTVSP